MINITPLFYNTFYQFFTSCRPCYRYDGRGVLESKLPLQHGPLYMGYASDVARILRKCLRIEKNDEQYAMQVVLSTHRRSDIFVDVDCRHRPTLHVVRSNKIYNMKKIDRVP